MKNQKTFVLQSAGPSLGSGAVKVKLREVGTMKESVVPFARFVELKKAGRIEKPAFVLKEKR